MSHRVPSPGLAPVLAAPRVQRAGGLDRRPSGSAQARLLTGGTEAIAYEL
jgi:hypothetical protein